MVQINESAESETWVYGKSFLDELYIWKECCFQNFNAQKCGI